MYAKCDDVIVNFVCSSQTVVKLSEFKEQIEQYKDVVLTDKQAKTLFDEWLFSAYAKVDGQQAMVDFDMEDDHDMTYDMDCLFQSFADNTEIPKDWQVKKCVNCEDLSVGTYGETNEPLCDEHKQLSGFNSEGVKEPEPFNGCEHPSPEVKEVEIVSNKPEVIDFFEGKAKPVRRGGPADLGLDVDPRDKQIEDLIAENAKLKERIRSVVKHFEMMISSII
jgi:hypothetical protein